MSNQKELLDTLYTEYENILNGRLDNVDQLIADVKAEVNLNASTIKETLEGQTKQYGTDLSSSAASIVTALNNKTVEEGIKTAIDGLATKLNDLYTLAENKANENVNKAKKDDDKVNNTKKEEPKSTTTPTTTPTTTTTPKQQEKKIEVGGKINAGSAKIYDYAGDTSGERQYYKNDPIYKVLGEKNGYLKVRHHKLSSGVTGWFKKSDVKAYKTGVENLLEDQLALTQEVAPEAIVRKDGSVLMPLTRGTSVLNGEATKNFYEFMNNPLSYMTDLLNKEAVAASPNNTSIGNKIESNVNLAITLPGVTNYEEFKSKIVRDKDFEKTLQAMTIDLVTGKSALSKYKK